MYIFCSGASGAACSESLEPVMCMDVDIWLDRDLIEPRVMAIYGIYLLQEVGG